MNDQVSLAILLLANMTLAVAETAVQIKAERPEYVRLRPKARNGA